MTDLMTQQQYDTLSELVNVGIGRAAGMLNIMLDQYVRLMVPHVNVFELADFQQEMRALGQDHVSAVRLSFRGPFSGTTSLVFPPDSAVKLVDVISGEVRLNSDMDSVRIGTLSEIGNIVINGVMGSVANMLAQPLDYTVPTYIENSMDILLNTHQATQTMDPTVILAQARFEVESLQVHGSVLIWFELGSFDALLAAIDRVNSEMDSDE